MIMEEFYDHIKKHSDPSGLEITSFTPVIIGEWAVRASVSNIDSVVIFMIKHTDPTVFVMGTFTDEVKANDFLNFWLDF